jgi:hypothetical protein
MNLGVTILYKEPNKKVRVNQERLHKRVSCRFHHALHEPGGHHPLQETKQKGERCIYQNKGRHATNRAHGRIS